MDREIVVASNRGPVSFERGEHGDLVARRGGGGLVTALAGAMRTAGGLWIAAAMTPEDAEAAAKGRITPQDAADFDVRYLAFPPHLYERYYNGVSNRILWFVHHFLWDIPREPRFGPETALRWRAYRRVNETFADALHEEGSRIERGAAYLVQDYHLSLVPALLRARQPNARIAHFSHVPFAAPTYLRVLPAPIVDELMIGLLGADVVGFHAEPWADNFVAACRTFLGANVDGDERTIVFDGRHVKVGIYPVSIDPKALRTHAGEEGARRERRRLERWLGDAKLVLRVDRTDLSKNILRGFLAFETLLRSRPHWRRRVRFLALLHSSRSTIPEYRAYVNECVGTANRINEEFGEDGWEPIRVSLREEHYATVLAAYSMYDVLLVNPVYDGMNLVAKEGPMLNERDGVLVLSENAGAFAELGSSAVAINPFDVGATADAIARGLLMPRSERHDRLLSIREAIERNRLEDWVGRQLEDL